VMAKERSSEPLMPPSEGTWLARTPSRFRSFYDPIEYLRPLSKAETDSLDIAHEYFRLGKQQTNVESLFKAYRDWSEAPIFVAEATRLGGPPQTEVVEDRLLSYLLVWRMAIDQLANATSTHFGRESEQWKAYQEGRRRAYDAYFGYRVIDAMRNLVVHKEMPPLTHTLIAYPYNCDKCGNEHANLDLSVSVSKSWFLGRERCPRVLRRDLINRDEDAIDIRAAVAESVRGFEDLLLSILLASDPARRHLAALINMFNETSPDAPVTVERKINENGRDRARVKDFNDLEWVITRT
jgi:hypothetical protein